jgi:hypothetical protein
VDQVEDAGLRQVSFTVCALLLCSVLSCSLLSALCALLSAACGCSNEGVLCRSYQFLSVGGGIASSAEQRRMRQGEAAILELEELKEARADTVASKQPLIRLFRLALAAAQERG